MSHWCDGKEQMTHANAQEVCRRLNRKKNKSQRATIYLCDTCKQWHVGGKKKR